MRTGFAEDLLIIVRLPVQVAIHRALDPTFQRLEREGNAEDDKYLDLRTQRYFVKTLSHHRSGKTEEGRENSSNDESSEEVNDASTHYIRRIFIKRCRMIA